MKRTISSVLTMRFYGFIQGVSTQEQTGNLQRRRRAQESRNCIAALGLFCGVFLREVALNEGTPSARLLGVPSNHRAILLVLTLLLHLAVIAT
jgi:hypothetical protein